MAKQRSRRQFGSITEQKRAGKTLKTLRVQYRAPDTGKWVTAKQHGRVFSVGQKQAAGAWLSEIQAQINQGKWVHPEEQKRRDQEAAKREQQDSYTVQEWFDRWVEYLRQNKGTSTVRTYPSRVRQHFLPVFGDRAIRSITRREVIEWWESLTTERTWDLGNGPETVPALTEQNRQAVYRVVSSMFTTALNYEVIDATPVKVPGAGKKLPTKRPKIDRIATDKEVAAIVASCTQWVGIAVTLAYECALRWEEIAALTRADLNLTDGAATVTVNKAVQRSEDGREVLGEPKSQASNRTIPIPDHCLPALRKHLTRYVLPKQSALIVHGESSPRSYMSNDQMHRMKKGGYNQARDKAGMPKTFRFHDLRVSRLTLLGRAGATLAELMMFAGHDDPKTVMRYQVAEAQQMRALSERMAASREQEATVTPLRRTGTQ